MKHPITGAPVFRFVKNQTLKYKGEELSVPCPYWAEKEDEEGFTTEEDDEYFLKLIQNMYRAKHKIPHPEDLKATREKLGLSANKLALILGISPNAYRNYEDGEMPSLSNAKLLQVTESPASFREFVFNSDELTEKEKHKLLSLLPPSNDGGFMPVYNHLLGNIVADLQTGLRKPNEEKAIALTALIANKTTPGKVKQNKLHFYCEHAHFRKHARSITGSRFRAVAHGPIHFTYEYLFNEAEQQKAIEISNEQIKGDYIQHTLTAKWDSTKCESYFTSAELETIHEVLSKLGHKTASELETLSHNEDAWKLNCENNDLIEYSLAPKLSGV